MQNSNVNDSLRSVRFINSQTGYTAGANGRILKTTDSGNNWISLQLNTNIDLLSIFTYSDNFVCCCGDSGLILISSNAGISWTSANVTSLKLRSLFLTDALSGHIIGDS